MSNLPTNGPDDTPDHGEESPSILPFPNAESMTLDEVLDRYGERAALEWRSASPGRRIAMQKQWKDRVLLTMDADEFLTRLRLLGILDQSYVATGTVPDGTESLEARMRRYESELNSEYAMFYPERMKRRMVQIAMLRMLIAGETVTYDAVLRALRSNPESQAINQQFIADEYRGYLTLLVEQGKIVLAPRNP